MAEALGTVQLWDAALDIAQKYFSRESSQETIGYEKGEGFSHFGYEAMTTEGIVRGERKIDLLRESWALWMEEALNKHDHSLTPAGLKSLITEIIVCDCVKPQFTQIIATDEHGKAHCIQFFLILLPDNRYYYYRGEFALKFTLLPNVTIVKHRKKGFLKSKTWEERVYSKQSIDEQGVEKMLNYFQRNLSLTLLPMLEAERDQLIKYGQQDE
jgi:hypothetical protein